MPRRRVVGEPICFVSLRGLADANRAHCAPRSTDGEAQGKLRFGELCRVELRLSAYMLGEVAAPPAAARFMLAV